MTTAGEWTPWRALYVAKCALRRARSIQGGVRCGSPEANPTQLQSSFIHSMTLRNDVILLIRAHESASDYVRAQETPY
ncbi:unnamed protein product [Pieris macdunnoughi]|uniref:Uncharacterized protein n=1 Tax=Pieris macdunnoughi TaxID=345717 RepID=A0A821LA37_9NEOP|nr:unnamed protein product [Pieris macdunnoughi]